MKIRLRIWMLLFTVWPGTGVPAHGEQDAPKEIEYPRHIIFVIDHSGSMQKTDPHGSRVSVIQALLQKAPTEIPMTLIRIGNPGDRAPRIYEETWSPGKMTELKRLLSNNFHGLTDIYGAMKRAEERAEKLQTSTPVIVLLTDGEIDLDGDWGPGTTLSREEKLSADNLVNSVIVLGIEEMGVPVFVFGVPGTRYDEFLRRIVGTNRKRQRDMSRGIKREDDVDADSYKGVRYYYRIDDIEDAPKMAVDLAQLLWGRSEVVVTEVLPSRFEFTVDEFFEEFVVDVFHTPGADLGKLNLRLEGPAGTVLDRGAFESTRYGARFHYSELPGMVSFQVWPSRGSGLEPGEWAVVSSDRLVKHVDFTISVDSDLSLDLRIERSSYLSNERIPIRCDVRLNGRSLAENPRVRDLRVSAEIRNLGSGQFVEKVELRDDGLGADGAPSDSWYSSFYDPSGEGEFEITVSIDGNIVGRDESVTVPAALAQLKDSKRIKVSDLRCGAGPGEDIFREILGSGLQWKRGVLKRITAAVESGDDIRLLNLVQSALNTNKYLSRKSTKFDEVAMQAVGAEIWLRMRRYIDASQAFDRVLGALHELPECQASCQNLVRITVDRVSRSRSLQKCSQCDALFELVERSVADGCRSVASTIETARIIGCPNEPSSRVLKVLEECNISSISEAAAARPD